MDNVWLYTLIWFVSPVFVLLLLADDPDDDDQGGPGMLQPAYQSQR